MKIKEMHVTKTQKLEARTTTVEESTKITKDNSGEVNKLNKNFREGERLGTEINRPSPMLMYPAKRVKLVFKGSKKDSPIQFILNCDQEMDLTEGNRVC